MRNLLALLIMGASLSACGVYNQNIMFKTKESIIQNTPEINQAVKRAEKNYLIQKNDLLEIRIFTDSGEFIVEPFVPATIDGNNLNQNRNLNQNPNFGNFNNINNPNQIGQAGGNIFPLTAPIFLVREDGKAKIPMIGEVTLEGLTLNQADSLLEIKFSDIYTDPYVRTRYNNKRVIVFKGTEGIIFPLRNEKINLVEVLAQTGGMGNNLRASNIRLIRGNLSNPDVYVINLRTLEGLRKYDLTVEPNDIIYVEPVRKTFIETLRDIGPIFGFITSLASVITVIITVTN